MGVRVVAGLGDGDSVQRQVELPVAGGAETMALLVGRPHRQRGGAVVARVGVLGAEPPHVGGLANQLGRSEHPTASKRQQRRRVATNRGTRSASSWSIWAFSSRTRATSWPASRATMPSRRLRNASLAAGGWLARATATEQVGCHAGSSSCRCQRSRLMTQVRSVTRSPVVVDQQPELPGGAVQPGSGQVGLPQRRPRHRQRIDRVRLASHRCGRRYGRGP